MRNVPTTTVHVIVADRLVRTNGVHVNVVKTLHDRLLRQCCILREACWAMALAIAKRMAQPGFEAKYVAFAVSPSWGGHRPSGVPGQSSRS